MSPKKFPDPIGVAIMLPDVPAEFSRPHRGRNLVAPLSGICNSASPVAALQMRQAEMRRC